MTVQLPPDFISRVRHLISPFTRQIDEREAMIDEAFFLHDPIVSHVSLDGAQKVFCVRLIKQLVEYGCIDLGEHSIARLLNTIKEDCEVDKHSEIDTLVDIVNTHCTEKNLVADTSPILIADSPSLPTQTIITPRHERTPTVFISYSHTDTEFAKK